MGFHQCKGDIVLSNSLIFVLNDYLFHKIMIKTGKNLLSLSWNVNSMINEYSGVVVCLDEVVRVALLLIAVLAIVLRKVEEK